MDHAIIIFDENQYSFNVKQKISSYTQRSFACIFRLFAYCFLPVTVSNQPKQEVVEQADLPWSLRVVPRLPLPLSHRLAGRVQDKRRGGHQYKLMDLHLIMWLLDHRHLQYKKINRTLVVVVVVVVEVHHLHHHKTQNQHGLDSARSLVTTILQTIVAIAVLAVLIQLAIVVPMAEGILVAVEDLQYYLINHQWWDLRGHRLHLRTHQRVIIGLCRPPRLPAGWAARQRHKHRLHHRAGPQQVLCQMELLQGEGRWHGQIPKEELLPLPRVRRRRHALLPLLPALYPSGAIMHLPLPLLRHGDILDHKRHARPLLGHPRHLRVTYTVEPHPLHPCGTYLVEAPHPRHPCVTYTVVEPHPFPLIWTMPLLPHLLGVMSLLPHLHGL